jgi:hypothetical protein
MQQVEDPRSYGPPSSFDATRRDNSKQDSGHKPNLPPPLAAVSTECSVTTMFGTRATPGVIKSCALTRTTMEVLLDARTPQHGVARREQEPRTAHFTLCER